MTALRALLFLLLTSLVACKGWDDDPSLFPQYDSSLLVIETQTGTRLYRISAGSAQPFTYYGLEAGDSISSVAIYEQTLYATLPGKQQVLVIDLKDLWVKHRFNVGFRPTGVAAGEEEAMVCGPGRMRFFRHKNPDKKQDEVGIPLTDSLVAPSYQAGNYFLAGKDGGSYRALVVNAQARTGCISQEIAQVPTKWDLGNLLAGQAGNRILYSYNVFTRVLDGPTPRTLVDQETSPLYRRPYEREFLGSIALPQDSLLTSLTEPAKVHSIALDSWSSLLFYTTATEVVRAHLPSRSITARIALPGRPRIRQAVHYYRY